ncbi:hypothetical protein SUGI_0714800 [Cryptomeria japonica]|uniref:uncharacterized protein LOC131067282 isoform X2 n=1 Tax=Cryptomeria japonica TaxID=3369 RepID=UPI002414CBAE|nr:uncharacterized protein LOC131067282 isoform X2 [Cryptomeria japonica]GLJ35546.1 hypothetical protein SUGI_0714800 [Cryptomeria japonica]
MKCFSYNGIVVLIGVAFFLVPSMVLSCNESLRVTDIMCMLVAKRLDPRAEQEEMMTEGSSKTLLETITGSSIPDCSWACGACNPCIRVTMNPKHFQPQSNQHDSLNSKHGNQHGHKISPIAHRCVCQGKSFPVP